MQAKQIEAYLIDSMSFARMEMSSFCVDLSLI